MESLAPIGNTYSVSPLMSEPVQKERETQPISKIIRELFLSTYALAEKSILLEEEAIKIETELRKSFYEQLDGQQLQKGTIAWYQRIISIVSDALAPTALAVTGGIAIAATGGAPLPIIATIVGGLFALENLLDKPAQRYIASWLGQGSEEDTRNWLGRIKLFTDIAFFVITLGIAPDRAVAIATGVSKAVVEGANACAEWKKNNCQAFMKELDAAIQGTDWQMQEHRKKVEAHFETIVNSYTNMISLQKSQQYVTSSIFAG